MVAPRLALHLTDRCQLNCDHCIRDPGLKPVDLDAELALRVAVQCRDLLGTSVVSLTGGEPTLHPHFVPFVADLAREGLRWNMVSNGIGLARTLLALRTLAGSLDSVESIVLSLDGHDAATHDAIRGEGSFRAVLDAVAACVVHRIPVALQATIHARNAGSMRALVDLAASVGAREMKFSATLPTGTLLDRTLQLGADDYHTLRDALLASPNRPPLPVSFNESWHRREVLRPCESWLAETVHVDYAGNLSLCCVLAGSPSAPTSRFGDDRIASLVDTPFEDAWGRLVRAGAAVHAARVDDVVREGASGWDGSLCNWCTRGHGKPHWSDARREGPAAQRPRWRGAWDLSHHPLAPTLAATPPHDEG